MYIGHSHSAVLERPVQQDAHSLPLCCCPKIPKHIKTFRLSQVCQTQGLVSVNLSIPAVLLVTWLNAASLWTLNVASAIQLAHPKGYNHTETCTSELGVCLPSSWWSFLVHSSPSLVATHVELLTWQPVNHAVTRVTHVVTRVIHVKSLMSYIVSRITHIITSHSCNCQSIT